MVWIASAATYLFISGWFDTITANHRSLAVAFVYDFWVKAPLIRVFHLVRTEGDQESGNSRNQCPDGCRTCISWLLLFSSPCSSTLRRLLPRTAQLYNLRFFWTGLDIFELIGLALTAWCLFRRSRYVAVTATITGTLLFSDAWFNFVTTVGKAQRAAIVMACAEVPISIYSFVIARREVSSWSATTTNDLQFLDKGDGDRHFGTPPRG